MEFLSEHGGAIVTGTVALLVVLITEVAGAVRDRRRWARETRTQVFLRLLSAAEVMDSLIGTASRDRAKVDPQKLGLGIREFEQAASNALMLASTRTAHHIRRLQEAAVSEYDTAETAGWEDGTFATQVETVREAMKRELAKG